MHSFDLSYVCRNIDIKSEYIREREGFLVKSAIPYTTTGGGLSSHIICYTRPAAQGSIHKVVAE